MKKAELRADGKHRAVIRIEHHLTLREMAEVVALALYCHEPRRLTYGAVRVAASTELRYRGGAAGMTFTDRINHDQDNGDFRLARTYNNVLRTVAASFGYPDPKPDDYLAIDDEAEYEGEDG